MSDIFSVENKRAIVTGGSRGIGLAMAKGLHDAGAEVTIFYNSTDVSGVFGDDAYGRKSTCRAMQYDGQAEAGTERK